MLKRQYYGLTVVLVIPLLLLGWWLAENEKVLPLHNVIYCQESDSDINCNSISATKSEANQALYQNAAVRLSGARLERGFNHSVVTLGRTELKFVDGEMIELPPVGGGVKKNLSLPPRSIQGKIFSYCEINPYSDSEKYWGYSCSGSGMASEGFYFEDEGTSKKFKNAKNKIEEQIKNNEAMNIYGLFATVLTPIIFYLISSLVIFLLVKIVRYVVYGSDEKKFL